MRLFGVFLMVFAAFMAACDGGPTSPDSAETTQWYVQVETTRDNFFAVAGSDLDLMWNLGEGRRFTDVLNANQTFMVGTSWGTGTFPGEEVQFRSFMDSPQGRRLTVVRTYSQMQPKRSGMSVYEGDPFSYSYTFPMDAPDITVNVAFLYVLQCKEEGEFIVENPATLFLREDELVYTLPSGPFTIRCLRM